jgi:hypothetical protein
MEEKFGIEHKDSRNQIPCGIAVLVNLNQGIGLRRSVKSEEELLRHIKLIEWCTFEQLYTLEFLDMLPCNSFKIFSDQPKEKIPIYIFKHKFHEVSER